MNVSLMQECVDKFIREKLPEAVAEYHVAEEAIRDAALKGNVRTDISIKAEFADRVVWLLIRDGFTIISSPRRDTQSSEYIVVKVSWCPPWSHVSSLF